MVPTQVQQEEEQRDCVNQTNYDEGKLTLGLWFVQHNLIGRADLVKDVDVEGKDYCCVNQLDPDQSDEQAVVALADAIVEPHAVVVKATGTPVATTTVLGLVLHMALAPLAKPLILVSSELYILGLAVPLFKDDGVTWISPAAEQSVQQHRQVEDSEYSNNSWFHHLVLYPNQISFHQSSDGIELVDLVEHKVNPRDYLLV